MHVVLTVLLLSVLINPRRACTAGVTLLGLSVCLSVQLFSHYRLRGGP